MADKLVALDVVDTISAECVRITLKQMTSHRGNTQWVIPPQANAECVCAMEDVLEVYTRPYDSRRPQVCVDETSTQLVAETRLPIPAAPGQPERIDDEYERQGTANLCMVFEPLAGQRRVKVTERRTSVDFAPLIRAVVDEP